MQVSRNPTVHLEEHTLIKLEAYRQYLATTKRRRLNYDKVIAHLLLGVIPRKPKKGGVWKSLLSLSGLVEGAHIANHYVLLKNYAQS